MPETALRPAPRRILVLRGGALGDFIVTLPALAALRRHFPDTRIELVGNATAAQLAVKRGLIDTVHSQHEARWSTLYGAAPMPSDMSSWVSEFDLVLSFWPDPEGELAARFPARAGQQFIAAPALPRVAPAAAHYCAPLRVLGIPAPEPFFAVTPSRPAPERAGISVHPGSGSLAKNWPLERWRAVLAALPSPATIVLGDAECERWLTDEQSWPSGNIQTTLSSVPLEQLVEHFASTRLFLGHDSGVSHLAAACGARCVLLFGPTNPEIWAPPAPHVKVIRAGTAITDIDVTAVVAAVRAAWGH
jgi:ADP-heptose:LPS heptosyltransferase